MARLLLRAGADANMGAPGAGPPLVAAVKAGDDDMARILLNAGADPNVKAPGSPPVLIQAIRAAASVSTRTTVVLQTFYENRPILPA